VSKLVWILGVLITLAGCVGVYFWPAGIPELNAFILGTIGLTLTLVCEVRIKLGEMERSLEAAIPDKAQIRQIEENGNRDDFFRERYAQLLKETKQLAEGTYHLSPLEAIYRDDRRSIGSLRAGERLLSTCPISRESIAAAVQQIAERNYLASIESHVAAAKRGVLVTRIYSFSNRKFFEHPNIKEHLAGLAKADMDIWVIFLDEVRLGPEIDFLVFGNHKVSLGVIDPATGKVWSARASIAKAEVDRYTREYDHLKGNALPLSELLTP